jgi:glycosyltransferase involved in cell wall biosynthesis
MKYAFLVMYELRALKKTIENLYKYVIDFYDADIIILCQRQFEEDESLLKLFNRNVKYCNLYDKPNPASYFNVDEISLQKNIDLRENPEYRGLWNAPGNLQIYINMNEMAKIIEKYKNEYDYFITLRTDIDILFPFPDKEIFEKIPPGVYGFYPSYSRSWGGLGEGNFIHKNYIIDYLTSCNDFIRNNPITSNIFNERQNYFYKLKDHFFFIKIDSKEHPILKKHLNQELLLLLSLKEKGIKIKNINNLNFYYTAEGITDYTTTNTIKTDGIHVYKNMEQLMESKLQLDLWNNNYGWTYENECIYLKKPNYDATISILIRNYNYGKYIRKALDSIFEQRISYPFIVIIIDDKSEDNSVEIISEYTRKYPNKIQLSINKKNIGMFKTTLKLYEKTKTDYFTVLDSDDYWNDIFFIQNGLDFLELNKKHTIYGTNTAILENDRLDHYVYNENKIIDVELDKNIDYFFTHTSSTIFRNVYFKNKLPNRLINIPIEHERYFGGDSFRNILHLQKGSAHVELGKVGGIYVNSGGIWNGQYDHLKNLINFRGSILFNKYFNSSCKNLLLNNRFTKSAIHNLLKYYENNTDNNREEVNALLLKYSELNKT